MALVIEASYLKKQSYRGASSQSDVDASVEFCPKDLIVLSSINENPIQLDASAVVPKLGVTLHLNGWRHYLIGTFRLFPTVVCVL